jgi:hypothetical protein
MFARCNSIPRAISDVRDVLNWLEKGGERPFAEWECQSLKVAEAWALIVHVRQGITNEDHEQPVDSWVETCNNVICDLNSLFAFTSAMDERNAKRQAQISLSALSNLELTRCPTSCGSAVV